MATRTLALWSIPLFAWVFSAGQPLLGATVSATYSFTGSAHNLVIANGYITSDGVASGSADGFNGVVFDTHNKVNLSTLQNYGTFKMIFPGGNTAYGNLHEDDTKVSLIAFSGPFTQILTFAGGTGQFEDVSGTLSGGGYIYPKYYTTSGAGSLTAPGLVASPEPGSGILLLIGLGAACFGMARRLRPALDQKNQ